MLQSVVRIALVILCASVCLAEAAKVPQVYVVNETMHADFEMWINGNSPSADPEFLRAAGEEAFAAADALNRVINYWDPASEISAVNREAAKAPVKCSEELYSLLRYCRKVWEATDGACDITVGPLVELWGFYKKEGHLPSTEELRGALEKVGMDKVLLDDAARTVHFARPGMRLDLGGIGKGLAVDRAGNVLRDKGIRSALISFGTSSVLALGVPADQPAGWKVKLRGPYNREDTVGEVFLRDESLSTSAGYERFFDLGGKKYCHIFNPKTGMPAEGVFSVSVIAPTARETDALDTGFFVLGTAGTRRFCETHPEIRVVLIADNVGNPEPVRFNFQERTEVP